MENVYMMEAFGKKFVVEFDYHYIYTPENRRITTCSIIELEGKSIYSGASMKHPKDSFSTWTARRWAFKRAVMYVFLVWTVQKKTSIGFNCFWQTFRKGLAQNELYIKDRKEEKNG